MTSAKVRKIQELREALDLSHEELSRRLGVDTATVRRWESGDEEPDEAILSRLAETPGVSQDALRHEEDARHHPG